MDLDTRENAIDNIENENKLSVWKSVMTVTMSITPGTLNTKKSESDVITYAFNSLLYLAMSLSMRKCLENIPIRIYTCIKKTNRIVIFSK